FQRLRIGRTDHPQGTGWRHEDQRLGLSGSNSTVELLHQLDKESPLRLLVPIGLLDRAARAADGAVGAARRIGAERMRRRVFLLENLDGLEIGEFRIAGVFENQCLFAIADNDPLAVTYQKFGHRPTSGFGTVILRGGADPTLS